MASDFFDDGGYEEFLCDDDEELTFDEWCELLCDDPGAEIEQLISGYADYVEREAALTALCRSRFPSACKSDNADFGDAEFDLATCFEFHECMIAYELNDMVGGEYAAFALVSDSLAHAANIVEATCLAGTTADYTTSVGVLARDIDPGNMDWSSCIDINYDSDDSDSDCDPYGDGSGIYEMNEYGEPFFTGCFDDDGVMQVTYIMGEDHEIGMVAARVELAQLWNAASQVLHRVLVADMQSSGDRMCYGCPLGRTQRQSWMTLVVISSWWSTRQVTTTWSRP